MKNGIR